MANANGVATVKMKQPAYTNKRTLVKTVKRDWDLYLLLIPGVIWFLMFAYKPMIDLRTAFYDYNLFGGFEKSDFVGFDNFIYFMTSPDFGRVLVNTLMISFWQIAICFPLPIVLAICITEMRNKFISRLTQTATFLPHFVSVVVVCGMVISFLSPSTGIVNLIMERIGIDPVYFMAYPQYFRGIYTAMTLWQTAGFNAIVYIAAIMGIDPELYDAARVDGAGKWKRIINITLPSIMPTVVTMLVLNIGKMVKVGYESILLLYRPTTYETADVISTFAYRMGLEQNDYGLSTAISLFEGVVALIMVLLANWISKKITNSGIW